MGVLYGIQCDWEREKAKRYEYTPNCDREFILLSSFSTSFYETIYYDNYNKNIVTLTMTIIWILEAIFDIIFFYSAPWSNLIIIHFQLNFQISPYIICVLYMYKYVREKYNKFFI